MRLVKYILIAIITLYLGLIIFMPKVEGYYKLEKILKEQGVVIDNEELISNPLKLKILHPVIYFQGIDIARAMSAEVTPLLLVNSVKLENVELLNVAKQALNIEINSLIAKESIVKPKIINLDINGSFGVANGYVDLNSNFVHIDIIEPKDIDSIKKFLTKSDKGWQYESNFK